MKSYTRTAAGQMSSTSLRCAEGHFMRHYRGVRLKITGSLGFKTAFIAACRTTTAPITQRTEMTRA